MDNRENRGKGVRLPFITGLTLAALWWLLSDGAIESWVIGLPTVIAATWAAKRLRNTQPLKISLFGVLRFLPLFAMESLRGGFDVAVRTLSPKMRIAPGFACYDTCLDHEGARIFFVNCVSLLPGTLAADLHEKQIKLHMLDKSMDPESDLKRLELAIGQIYHDCVSKRGLSDAH